MTSKRSTRAVKPTGLVYSHYAVMEQRVPAWISAILSSLHLLALALGLPAVDLRGRALKAPLDAAGFKHLFGGR